MTPVARIKAVIDLLEKIGTSRVPMDATTGDYMRFRRYIGSKDRANIAERVYAVMRAHARLTWWIENNGMEDTPRNYMMAYLALGENHNDIEKLFDGSKYGPDVLCDDEKKFLKKLQGQSLDHPKMPEAVRVECPPHYEEKLRACFGDDFAVEMAGIIAGAPLDLRVNIWRSNKEKVQKYMEADGVKTEDTPYCPWGLRVQGKAFLSRTKSFVKGWVEIQDEGSQLVSYICDVKPGMQVLDYCAGAGGKTLGLAAAMQNKGRIVAMDLEAGRLEKGRRRYKKAGVADIIEVRPLSDEKNRKWLRRQKGTFDLVLTDVPCTGTGTWRRNPDMRWRTYGPSLEELVETQAEILDKVAKAVKPGGRLVYATCSLLREENEDQIDVFLKAHPEFEVVILTERSELKDLLSKRSFADAQDDSGKYMRLTPRQHNTDGFFAAVMRRQT